jgi:hypothetical protein
MVWRVVPRSPTGTVVTDSPSYEFVQSSKIGAPNGVAPLDSSGKIPVTHMRMAPDTSAKFDQIEQEIASLPQGEVEAGDAIRVVGDVVHVDISRLTLAP